MQTLQHYRMIPHYVLIKFMQWDHILTLPQPAADLVYPQSVWRYATGMAFAGKNKLPEAKQALQALQTLMEDSTLKTITIWELNGADRLIDIASRVLQAEIIAKKEIKMRLSIY